MRPNITEELTQQSTEQRRQQGARQRLMRSVRRTHVLQETLSQLQEAAAAYVKAVESDDEARRELTNRRLKIALAKAAAL